MIRPIPPMPTFLPMSFEQWSLVFMGMQALVIFLGLVITAALMIVYERRMLALWQDRYGPNRVGWQGSLQLVADMLKIFFKEDCPCPTNDVECCATIFWVFDLCGSRGCRNASPSF